MKYIYALSGLFGAFCWVFSYSLMIYKGFKDKTYGMPLIALSLNFSWELVYSIFFPVNLYINLSWFLLDLGLVYTYFKYGYSYSYKFYSLPKKQWYFMSFLAFLIGFLIIYFGQQFFAQHLTYFPDNQIGIMLGFILLLVISIDMLAMFFQRKNSDGQSFIIICLLLLGSFFYGFQILCAPVFNLWSSPFMVVILLTCIILEFYYAYLIYNQLVKERKNPWKIF